MVVTKLAALVLFACMQAPTVVAAGPTPHKDQPAATKLKLGHYRNDERGIGLVVDRTEKNASIALIDPAKVRFDGETKVWHCEGKHGPAGRIDYMRDAKHVLLHVYDDGQISVFVPDPDGRANNDEIDLYRDADADPL